MCTHQATEENFEKFAFRIWGLFAECYNYPATSRSSHVSVKLYTLEGISIATIHYFY
jgi:hypothetical protein